MKRYNIEMANSCNGCGLCCKLFYINLSKKEYESGKYETMFEEYGKMTNFNEVKSCGANLLAKNEDGGCIYLKDSLCSIHDDRPDVCRDFFCTTKAKRFADMVKIIEEHDDKKISSMFE